MKQLTAKVVNTWMKTEWMIKLIETDDIDRITWLSSTIEYRDDQQIANKLGVSTKAYRKAVRQYGGELRSTKIQSNWITEHIMVFWTQSEALRFVSDFIDPKLLAMKMVQPA